VNRTLEFIGHLTYKPGNVFTRARSKIALGGCGRHGLGPVDREESPSALLGGIQHNSVRDAFTRRGLDDCTYLLAKYYKHFWLIST
jgi:hypothetical protein